ncbi:ExoD protein [Lysobacter sp. A03]|nr:ExoD protein [Lysobacter sp. A03]
MAAEDGVGTRALLESFTVGDPEEVLPLGAMFGGLGKRSFGMLVFIAILPSFLPIPGIGGASGLLVVMLGLQLMAGLRVPWLPGFVARRGPTRRTIGRFRDRIAPWLARLERLSRPRAPAMLERRLANIFTGLLLVALGCLLCLPIPFTNYLFGVLLLLFALALLERDGYLMILAWLAGTAAVVFFSLISGQLATMIAQWIHG